MGLTPGVTTFSFGDVSDTVRVLVLVRVRVAAVPEPALTGLAIAGGLASLALIRRGARRGAVVWATKGFLRAPHRPSQRCSVALRCDESRLAPMVVWLGQKV